MNTNKEILENGYWSSSSNSSIRSEFDDEYYRLKPPPPNFEDYVNKLVEIKEGQFSQLEAQLQNVNLSNESKIQRYAQQNSDFKNLAASTSKNETNVNGRKAPDGQRFERGVPRTNGNNAQHKLNHNHFNNEYKISRAEQNQNLTKNENFRSGPNYVGPFTNGNANGNNTKPHQYSTPQSSITESNVVEDILSKRINQTPTTLYSINSSNTTEDTWREKMYPLPSQSNTPRSVKIENKQLYNVPLPTHSRSTDTTSSITGRCNTHSSKVDRASGKSKLYSSNHSKTYNTFLAVQPTASRNNAVQISQPATSNSVATHEEMATESECYRICCFWFCCCS